MGREVKASSRQAIVNFVNCILGASVLGYPYSYKSSGLVLGTILMAVSFIASRYSYQLLLLCSQLSSRRSLEDLTEQANGKMGRQLLQLCTAGINLGAMVAYLNILADVLSSVAGTIIPPGAEPSRTAYLVGVTVFGALPVSMIVRDHAVLATFSRISVIFMAVFSMVIFLFAVTPTFSTTTHASEGTVHMWRLDGALVAFPMMAYSFTAHPYYLGIYSNLKNPTMPRMARVTTLAMFLAAFTYWLVGVCGYIAFKDRTSGDLLRNFGAAHVMGARGAYERAVKLLYGVSILGSIPLVVLPFYNILLPMLGFDPVVGSSEGRGKQRLSDSEDDTEESFSRNYTDTQSPLATVGEDSSTSSDLLSRYGSVPTKHTGTARSNRRSHSSDHQLDVVDLRLQHDGLHSGPSASSGDILAMIKPAQHMLVVLIVLGAGMSMAIWVPNVEFIFGITGATASVLMAYIIPPMTFIRLLDQSPELTGTKSGIQPEVRSQWVWRRRMALGLIIFGIIASVACTDAILTAVREENAVVELAQQLVAHEAVVAETSRVELKAQEAAAAVAVVETASAQLNAAHLNSSQTLSDLTQAANALSSITEGGGAPPPPGQHHFWNAWTQSHSKQASEKKVLHSVEVLLEKVKDDAQGTLVAVQAVVSQLDVTIDTLRTQVAAKHANATAAALAASSNTTDSTLVDDNEGLLEDEEVDKGAPSRAADLASELGKALGVISNVPKVTAGKSLMQVRMSAVAAAGALNQTIQVLNHVLANISAAKQLNKGGSEVAESALTAMRTALNSSATSALAVRLTTEALHKTAEKETDDLLILLTKVADGLEAGINRENPLEKLLFFGDSSSLSSSTALSSASADSDAESDSGKSAGESEGSGKVDRMDRMDSADDKGGKEDIQEGRSSSTSALTDTTSANGSEQVDGTDLASGATDGQGGAADNSGEGLLGSALSDLVDAVTGGGTDTVDTNSGSNASSSAAVGVANTDKADITNATDATTQDAELRKKVDHLKSVIEALMALKEARASQANASSAQDAGGAASSKTVFKEVEEGMDSGGAGATGSSTTDAAVDELGAELKNVTELLHDALKWTQGSKASVLNDIQETLSKADSKIQERVVGIMQDISDFGLGQPKIDQKADAVAQSSAEKDVVGPTVIVNGQGQLVQKDPNSTIGPIITEKEQQDRLAAAGRAGGGAGEKALGRGGVADEGDSSSLGDGSGGVEAGRSGDSTLVGKQHSDTAANVAQDKDTLNRKLVLGAS